MTKIQNLDEAKKIIEHYENLISLLPAHVYWKDKEGKFLGCNDLQAKDAGFSSKEEMVGKTDYDFVPKGAADAVRKVDLEVMRTKTAHTVEELIRHENGNDIIFLSKKVPICDNLGNSIGILGISFDISQRKAKEKEVEITLDNIIANLPGHVYWKDKNFIYRGCNEIQAQNAGFSSREDMIGKTDYEMPWRADADALRKADKEVMKTGEVQTVEEPSVLASGKKAIFLSKKIPLKDSDNNIVGILGISFDITEQKKLEEKLAEAKAQEEHLKAMSSIGGMIAHELKTPLMSIALNARSIKKFFPILLDGYREYVKMTGSSEIREGYLLALEKIADDTEHSANYANNIIKTILEGFHYSTSKSVKLEAINVNALIQEALDAYPFTEYERGLVEFHPTHEYKALGSPSIMIHVFHNLIKNSLYAIRSANRGKIAISVKEVQGNSIHIQFKDTAKGISETIRQHIFEPFYTTKAEKTSVGLGLYFCTLVLEKIQAHIVCESVEGEYALFTLILNGLRPEEELKN